nr:hypothetical protein CFP56_16092 [Quercus suber]
MDMTFIVKNGSNPEAQLLPPPSDMPPSFIIPLLYLQLWVSISFLVVIMVLATYNVSSVPKICINKK